jgi:hypothetical protein
MIPLRLFAGQAQEELAFALFAERRSRVPSTICTKLAKAQHEGALGLKGSWECKDYPVTTENDDVRTSSGGHALDTRNRTTGYAVSADFSESSAAYRVVI